MDLTREKIEKLAKYDSVYDGEQLYMGETVAKIAKQLLAEMDKPNLWKDAPIDACHMRGLFTNKDEKQVSEFAYHRTPPKSPEREIAEKLEDDICTLIGYHGTDSTREKTRVLIESAIKEALEKAK